MSDVPSYPGQWGWYEPGTGERGMIDDTRWAEHCAQDVTCPAATLAGHTGFMAPMGNKRRGSTTGNLKDLVEVLSEILKTSS